MSVGFFFPQTKFFSFTFLVLEPPPSWWFSRFGVFCQLSRTEITVLYGQGISETLFKYLDVIFNILQYMLIQLKSVVFIFITHYSILFLLYWLNCFHLLIRLCSSFPFVKSFTALCFWIWMFQTEKMVYNFEFFQ